MSGNWGIPGRNFGLQKLDYNDQPTFEPLEIVAIPEGFKITFTESLDPRLMILPEDIEIQQWRYEATADYGGPKLDHHHLQANKIELSEDDQTLIIHIDHLKAGHVVYFQLPDHWHSKQGLPLWSGDIWYTLNNIPLSKET